MWIEPNTNIKILKDIPLDSSYEHTLYFDSANEQSQYFAGQAKYNLTEQTYQRVQRGWARVSITAENLFDCNYIMFKNTNFGNKWFYAFITHVEYKSNIVSDVFFEIDVIQTWLFDFHLQKCYVEREHSVTDEIGNNIMPEPVEIGEYVLNDSYGYITDDFNSENKIALMFVNPDVDNPQLYDGIFGAGELHIFDATTTGMSQITEFINNKNQHPESIVGIYMIPGFITNKANGERPDFASGGFQRSFNKNALDGNEMLNGYTPRNKKLYTYPYNCYLVHNNTGQSCIYRYEFFSKINEKYTPTFLLTSNITAPVSVVCMPTRYKGTHVPTQSLEAEEPYICESVTITGYPMCSWSQDAFKAWWAQNSVPMIIKGATALL